MDEQINETSVLANPGVVDVAVGVDEKSNNNGGVEGGNNQGGVNVSVVSGGETEFRAKRKRGRPRKDETEERRVDFMVVPEYSSAPPQKRGRGRPKGSGKLQHVAASLGGRSAEIGTAGSNFTPCVITLQVGEDIYQTLWSFSERTLDSICILSACGTLSSAEIRLPGSRGGTVKHEGWLHIMSLNGSHTYTEQGAQRGKNCLLSVHFVNGEGQFYGGSVVGPLIVAAPTMLVIGTFREPVMMRQHLEPPKPKIPANTIVAIPLQAVNGTLLEPEANGVATIPPVPIPQADDVDKSMEDPPDVIAASYQHPPPIDESGDVMDSQDANPMLDQQDPPIDDDVYKVEMGPDIVPASPQPTDWNSLQPVESEHVSELDIGATDQ